MGTTRKLVNQHFIPKQFKLKLWLNKIQRDIDFTNSQTRAMPSDLIGNISVPFEE